MFALRPADTGITVAEGCRKMGVSEATYYNWKKKYGALGVPELRRLRQLGQLAEENQHLKQLVADLSLDKQLLQDVLKKKFCSPGRSPRGATPYRRQAQLGPPRLPCSAPVGPPTKRTAGMIRCCASACVNWPKYQVRYGSQRLYILLRRAGWPDNHMRVPRLYCLDG